MTRCMTSGMMSSNTDEWATPQWVFNHFHKRFHFDLDVCATPENAKCPKFFTKEQDGLRQVWTGNVWCNPPYGRNIKPWVEACARYGRGGGIAVCLVPARTDTKWWRECCMTASEIILIPGRLKFGDSKNSAPFPSAIVIFGTPRYPQFSMLEVRE